MSWPRIAQISPGQGLEPSQLVERVIRGYGIGLGMLVLREPLWQAKDHAFVTQALGRECPKLCLVHHEKTPGAAEVDAPVHLAGDFARRWEQLALPSRVGVSAHSVKELQRAQRLGASYGFLSPIWPPNSKPADRRPCLGPQAYVAARSLCSMPVYALGGVNSARAAELGLDGQARVALVGGFWRDSWDEVAREWAQLSARLGV